MYARRIKRTFPPGTFLPTPARVTAIIQLCLAFAILAWNASQPFMGELFSIKSRMLLYQHVMGIEDQQGLLADLKKLERNADRFNSLPSLQKQSILEGYEGLQKLGERTFWIKLKRSFQILALGIPSFEQAWIFFSILIPILLLKRVNGAAQVVWILPVLAVLYAADNRWNGISQKTDQEAQLFPTETVLVEDYLKHPLSHNIFEQREELLYGWQIYLIEKWAHEVPSKSEERFEEQAERGEFAFNIARLETVSPLKHHPHYSHLRTKESLMTLSIYIFWNLCLAFTVRFNTKL